MKKTILTLSACFVLFSLQAQKITVKSSTEKFSTGSQNALNTTIYESSKDDVESKWKSYLKDFKSEKIKTDKGEVFGDNVVIKEWGNNPVDIYATFEEDKTTRTVVMRVAFDLGGAYLNSSDNEKYKLAEKMVKDFAIKTTKEAIGDKAKDQEKVLAKLNDNQKDLEKENKNSKSDIESYKEKIKKAEDDIKKNEESQAKKKEEIEAQKKLVADTKLIMDKVD